MGSDRWSVVRKTEIVATAIWRKPLLDRGEDSLGGGHSAGADLAAA